MSLCLRDAPRNCVTQPLTFLLFPVRSVGPCLDATAGSPFTIQPVTTLLAPSRTFTMYAPLQGVVGLLCRLRHPDHALAFSRLWSWLAARDRSRGQDFPPSTRTDDRTVSCLLHAGWLGDNTSGVRRPDALHRTVLVQVIQPFAPVLVTTLTRRFLASAWVQGSTRGRVTAGSQCSWSAGFSPYPVPPGNASRSTLTPLS
jgi:hypothetical protein